MECPVCQNHLSEKHKQRVFSPFSPILLPPFLSLSLLCLHLLLFFFHHNNPGSDAVLWPLAGGLVACCSGNRRLETDKCAFSSGLLPRSILFKYRPSIRLRAQVGQLRLCRGRCVTWWYVCCVLPVMICVSARKKKTVQFYWFLLRELQLLIERMRASQAASTSGYR